MIVPLMYNADYRPYFTIHDSEFKEYMTKSRSPPTVILGVTNPFFGKTLQHWPHIIRLAENSSSGECIGLFFIGSATYVYVTVNIWRRAIVRGGYSRVTYL